MEPRPNPLLAYANLTAASAAAAHVKNGTMPDYRRRFLAGPGNRVALWITAPLNGLDLANRTAAGCTATKHGSKGPRWTTSSSGSSAGRWFFAQAPDPEEEQEQEEPEGEEETRAEPRRREAPAVRKQPFSEENAEQLREGGTINPPFP